MKRTRKWHKKLTVIELEHIKATTHTASLQQFKENRSFHLVEKEKTGVDLCLECRIIAVKLGLE